MDSLGSMWLSIRLVGDIRRVGREGLKGIVLFSGLRILGLAVF